MKIYYQWNPGSYMHLASVEIQKHLNIEIDEIIWKPDFKDVWESIGQNNIAVLAIENSYMWSIHPNLYGFLKYDCKIVGRYDMLIRHCLCSKEEKLEDITKAYSQLPALDQCHIYLKEKWISPMVFSDTSLAASHVAQSDDPWKAAICSEFAAKLNGLNILDRDIQDNNQNTTRFAIITHQDQDVLYKYDSPNLPVGMRREGKMSIIFEVHHIPWSLSTCLLVFHNRWINITKLESMPSFHKESFLFWINIEGDTQDENVSQAIKEVWELSESIKIIWEY